MEFKTRTQFPVRGIKMVKGVIQVCLYFEVVTYKESVESYGVLLEEVQLVWFFGRKGNKWTVLIRTFLPKAN